MSNTATAPAPRFRRIAPGLYGTGIYRVARGEAACWHEPNPQVELVIDRMPDCNGYVYWYIREMLPDGEVTNWVDDPEATLRMCKTLLTTRTNWYTD